MSATGADWDAVAVQLAEMFEYDATYNGSASCVVNLVKDVAMQPAGYDAQTWKQGTMIEYLLSEVGGTEPSIGDTFLIGSTTWTVKSVEENDGRFVRAWVK